MSNAFTASTSTNYYFELSASAKSNSPSQSASSSQASLVPVPKHEAPLYGALDRFAQFFVQPLFREDCLERELNAVDSENKKNLQADNWRLMQLAKSTAAREHPYHLFSTGNYKILHDDPIARGVKIRDAFIKFYQTHYSANRMKLVVLGKESLDELQAWVEELFSGVVNKDLPQLRWDGIPVLTEKELCTQIFTKPVMDMKMLELSFPYPDEEDLYESMPGRYLGHLIGHEGPGSILAYLKAKGLITELSAGPAPVCPGTSFFSIGMRLTSKGIENYREVIKAVFQYIAMIKEESPKDWIVQEQAKLTEMEFKFQQKIPAARMTSHMAGVMQKPLPREWLLSGQYLVRKFNPDGIRRGLAALEPSNFRFTLSAQDLEGLNQKEQWYGTEYKVEKIPKDFIQELEAIMGASGGQRPAELHLPVKNEFIPQRLDVEKKEVATPAVTPKLIRYDSNVRVWWKKDDQFWVPKANVYIFLRNPVGYTSAYAAVLTMMFKQLVDDSLVEYAYDAELAGLGYSLERTSNAFQIMVSGYNDKLHVLLEKLLVTMRDFEVKDDRFDIIKERVARNYSNAEYQDPFRQINRYTQWLLKDRMYLSFELAEELPSITAEDVRSFIPQLLRQMHVEVLAHGNMYKEDALRVADMVEKTLRPRPLPQSQWENPRVLALPSGVDYVYERPLKNPDNVNHCFEYSMIIGEVGNRSRRAKLLLLDQMMHEPVFDTLRTKEQLGYIVGGSAIVLGNVDAFRILVQSEKDCEYVRKRADLFLIDFENSIKDMPAEDFEAHKVGIINKRLEKLRNLGQESGRLWHHIVSEQFDFELVYRDVENIEPLTKEDLLDFYATYFNPNSSTRSTVAVHLVAQTSAKDIAAQLTDAEKHEKLAEQTLSLLKDMGIPSSDDDQTTLVKELETVNTTGGDVPVILSAIGTWLTSKGIDDATVQEVLAQGQVALPPLLSTAGIVSPAPAEEANGHAPTNGSTNGIAKSKRVVIEDVKAFKASLPLTAAPQPVRDISEFEELEAKL
jgi:insulysin